MLLCASVASVAGDIASPYYSRIGLKVTYGRKGIELELVNKASSPIVAWAFRFSPKWEEARDPTTVAHPDAIPRTRGRLTCAAGSSRVDLIEPGETRHLTVNPPPNCPDGKIHHVSAIFADGIWRGDWSDLEVLVKRLTIRRLVLQRWLISLRALEVADDPLANLGKLMDDLRNVYGLRITTPGTPPPEDHLRKVIDFGARIALRMYVKRCYENVVLSDYGRKGNPKPRPRRAGGEAAQIPSGRERADR